VSMVRSYMAVSSAAAQIRRGAAIRLNSGKKHTAARLFWPMERPSPCQVISRANLIV